LKNKHKSHKTVYMFLLLGYNNTYYFMAKY
jgi:hypothetical protein